MANTDVYLNLVSGQAKLQTSNGSSVGRITLEYEDTMTVKLGTGFRGTTSLTDVTIYNWVNGAKSGAVGSWPASSTIGVLSVTPSGSDVVLQDADRGASDGDYGYAVTATSVVNGVTSEYTADPELLVKKRRGGTRADVAAPAARKPEAEI